MNKEQKLKTYDGNDEIATKTQSSRKCIIKNKAEIVLFTVYVCSDKPKESRLYIGESSAQNKKQ